MSTLKTEIAKFYIKQRSKVNLKLHGGCAVLLYHRVTNLETDPQLLSVSPFNFDSQIKILKENYNLISIEEFKYSLLNKKKFRNKSVILTFDDGYADNYLDALPILEKYSAQALFYIATGTLNTSNEYWWDAIERIILLSESQPVSSNYKIADQEFDLQNLNPEKKQKLYESLLPLLRYMNSQKREAIILELSELFQSKVGRASHRAMTFEELQMMSKSHSTVIGAHTHLHPSLGALSHDEQLNEIKASKSILEETLNEKIIHFSYPFGTIHDYNQDTIKICKQLNFELVAANYPSLVNRTSNPYCFPRFLVRDWNVSEFSNQLNSFFTQ